MKKFDEFINEISQPFDFFEMVDYVTNTLKKELTAIEVGNESTTVSAASSGNDIEGIGKRGDYRLEDGSFTHVIIGIRLFIGNGGFTDKFKCIGDIGKHLIKVEDTIRATFEIEKVSNFGDYYAYLIPITEEMRHAAKSTEGIKKFDL